MVEGTRSKGLIFINLGASYEGGVAAVKVLV